MTANGDRLWLVGQLVVLEDVHPCWALVGVFATEPDAIAACRDSTCFVLPLTVGHRFPDEVVTDPPCYFPHAGNLD